MAARAILLISDDPTFRYHAARELHARGVVVEVTSRPPGAIWPLPTADADGIVIEAVPDSDWTVVALVDRLREQPGLADIPIAVCLSDAAMLDAHSMYLALRGCSVHGRPFDADALAAALTSRRAIEPSDVVTSRSPAWS